MGHGRKCRITVLKCMVNEELASLYGKDRCPCARFHEGQQFILDQNSMSGYWHLMGGTFCAEAWASLSTYIDTILQGGTFDTPDGENYKIVSCPEGIHPVIFKVERYQESQTQ